MVSLWWEEVDSYKSESERACTHSEASSTETGGSGATRRAVYTAQNPRFPTLKKRHRDFSKEVDSLGVGQFSNIQQNAALCSAMLSKVHNGAVAVGRCEPRLTHAVSHPLSFAKKSSIAITILLFLVGRGGFEPPKAVPTDLQSAPFGHSGIFPRLELVVGVEPTTC